MEKPRSALWLIDAGYILKARRSIDRFYEIDYAKLKAYLQRQMGGIARSCLVNSGREELSEGERKFYNWLQTPPPRGAGIEAHLFPLRKTAVDAVYCEECGQKVSVACRTDARHTLSVELQKRVDVAIATFALAEMPRYDALFLSSGDGDLLPAIDEVQAAGRSLHLVVFRHGVSGELREKANQILWIDDIAGEVARGSR